VESESFSPVAVFFKCSSAFSVVCGKHVSKSKGRIRLVYQGVWLNTTPWWPSRNLLLLGKRRFLPNKNLLLLSNNSSQPSHNLLLLGKRRFLPSQTPFLLGRKGVWPSTTSFQVGKIPLRLNRTPFQVSITPFLPSTTPFQVGRTPFLPSRTAVQTSKKGMLPDSYTTNTAVGEKNLISASTCLLQHGTQCLLTYAGGLVHTRTAPVIHCIIYCTACTVFLQRHLRFWGQAEKA
jgi:hypothetical protein